MYIKNLKDNQFSSILERKGLIIIKGGKWEIFSLLFQEFVSNKTKIDTSLLSD